MCYGVMYVIVCGFEYVLLVVLIYGVQMMVVSWQYYVVDWLMYFWFYVIDVIGEVGLSVFVWLLFVGDVYVQWFDDVFDGLQVLCVVFVGILFGV